MNPLTPGPPPSHHQQSFSYHPAPPPNLGPVTNPCFNCGQMTHWAQQCPEPRRNIPVGAAQQNKPRTRPAKGGPGPIITRYPVPPQGQHPAPYHPSPYGVPAPIPSPVHPPPYMQHPAPQPPPQQYGAHYSAPPPPPPPHAIPPQPPHTHYPPPPPPHASPQYPYPSPVNGSYPAPQYPPQYPPQQPPPMQSHHHAAQYYPPQPPHPHQSHQPHQPYPQTTYQTPVPQHSQPYQFYQHPHPHRAQHQNHQHPPPPAPHYASHQHSHGPPVQHSGRHHPRQNSASQHSNSAPPPLPLPSHQPARGSVSEASPISAGANGSLVVWRPAKPVKRPLAATMAETDQQEEANSTLLEKNGNICKYWDKDGNRTKYHLSINDLVDDPAIRSFRTGLSRLLVTGPMPLTEIDDGHDAGDVAMDLGSTSSADGRPDVTDKLNGILSRQSSDHGNEMKGTTDYEPSRRRSTRDDDRSMNPSPRRGRSKSPSHQESSGSYRSRTPNGAGNSKRGGRMQYSLPTKPDTPTPIKPQSMVKPSNKTGGVIARDTPVRSKGRSRSASPRRGNEEEKRRHRDYENRYGGDTSQEKTKIGKESNKRRTSGTNGVPAAFARRW